MPSSTSDAIPKAAYAAGTVDKLDRRAQYKGPDCAKPEALLEAVNVQGNHIRGLQGDAGQIRRDVYNLKLRNSIIVALVTGAVMRGPDIWVFVMRWIAR